VNRKIPTFALERTAEPTCPSDLVLDRFLAGELTGAEREPIVAHLAACAACAARRAELEQDRDRFPNEVFVSGLAARSLRTARSRKPLVWGGLSALAAAAAVAFLVLPTPDGPPDAGPAIRSKGGDSLAVFASRGGAVEPLLPGDPLAPGDAIRFEVAAPTRSWVLVLGLDAAGVVTAYAAGDGEGVPLAAGAATVLPGSIVLDETGGAERLVALFCDHPVRAGDAVRAGERALARVGGDPTAALQVEVPGCRQASLPFRKVHR
jgi:hypothetical protein